MATPMITSVLEGNNDFVGGTGEAECKDVPIDVVGPRED